MIDWISGGSFFLAGILLVLGVLWFLLPFAVFGIKGKLDSIRDEIEGLRADLAGQARTEETPDKREGW
jgi:hypothetical protein